MQSLKFDNWLQRRFAHQQRRFCRAGDRVHIDYQPVYDAKGIWHLEESGKTNTYLEIQSHADSCDINIIMARYRNGETDVLSQIQGIYGDVTNIPTNYAEIMNAQLRAKDLFMSLAPEIREKYGNSVEQFMSSFSSKEGWEAIGFKFDDSAPAPAPAAEEQKEGAE